MIQFIPFLSLIFIVLAPILGILPIFWLEEIRYAR